MKKNTLIMVVVGILLMGGIGYAFWRNQTNQQPAEEPQNNQEETLGPEEEIQITDFSATGNLTRNNPGMKQDTWYLVYEKPGQPALSAELLFDQESVCLKGGQTEACESADFKNGDRAEVTGITLEEQIVLVNRLTRI